MKYKNAAFRKDLNENLQRFRSLGNCFDFVGIDTNPQNTLFNLDLLFILWRETISFSYTLGTAVLSKRFV